MVGGKQEITKMRETKHGKEFFKLKLTDNFLRIIL